MSHSPTRTSITRLTMAMKFIPLAWTAAAENAAELAASCTFSR